MCCSHILLILGKTKLAVRYKEHSIIFVDYIRGTALGTFHLNHPHIPVSDQQELQEDNTPKLRNNVYAKYV